MSQIFPLITTSLCELKAVAEGGKGNCNMKTQTQSELEQKEASFSGSWDFSVHMVLSGYLQG